YVRVERLAVQFVEIVRNAVLATLRRRQRGHRIVVRDGQQRVIQADRDEHDVYHAGLDGVCQLARRYRLGSADEIDLDDALAGLVETLLELGDLDALGAGAERQERHRPQHLL